MGTEAGLESAGIPELTVRPLDQAAASALLETRGELPPDARERLLREAAENPLALVELLPQPGRPEEQGRSYHSSHLSRRLERSFVARLEILPPHTQTVLLCAALNDADGLAETLKAASVLAGASLTEDDIRPARSAGLVEYDAWSVRFRHPLMRTAIGQATGIAERRAAHGGLATALSSDPGRRLWHQAASLSQPDESVARELQGVAERALTQGDLTGAAAAFDQAARLSTQPDGRSDLLLRAAEIQSQIGRLDEVQRLLRRAETGELRPAVAARKAWLECSVDMYERSGPGPIAPLVEIVERLRLAELTDLALAGLDQIAASLWTTARDDESRRAVVDAALRMPVSPTDPRLLAILGFAAPIEQGAVILDRLSRVDPALGRDALADFQLGLAALLAGAVVTATPFIDASVEGLRAQGRLGLLTAALSTQAYHGMWSGRWDLSYSAADEAVRLSTDIGNVASAVGCQVAKAGIAAHKGDRVVVETLTDAVEKLLLPLGARPMLAHLQAARGMLALGEGEYDTACDHFCRIYDHTDVAHDRVVSYGFIGDLVESAVRAGRIPLATAAVAELEPLVLVTGSPLMHASLIRARPLLAAGAQAESLFQAGLQGALTDYPFFDARHRLAYGMWLRRERRAADSRAPLRAARDLFDGLGAYQWGERARQELRASGETSRKRTNEARDQLSPQELQIAQMAAAGMTNREIAEKLFVSSRTVGSHLYRIFPKLGVASRSQLPHVLAARPGVLVIPPDQ